MNSEYEIKIQLQLNRYLYELMSKSLNSILLIYKKKCSKTVSLFFVPIHVYLMVHSGTVVRFGCCHHTLNKLHFAWTRSIHWRTPLSISYNRCTADRCHVPKLGSPSPYDSTDHSIGFQHHKYCKWHAKCNLERFAVVPLANASNFHAFHSNAIWFHGLFQMYPHNDRIEIADECYFATFPPEIPV